jgi:hypothetical protein
MARPGRTESASLPIWLKLSEADAAQLEHVLARPEFAGWTRAEWCLEIIQTALRYYARRDAADEPGRKRASARPAAAAPEPAGGAPETAGGAPEPAPAAAKPKPTAPKPRRAAPRARPAAAGAERPAAEAKRAAPGRAAPEARRAAPGRGVSGPAVPERPTPGRAVPEPEATEAEPLEPPECSHPAEARDYQTGTCGACGAILWD